MNYFVILNRHILWTLFILILLLVGCQTPEPFPTPTPTRTPILPTPTPTPTPTLTPTATPTITPTPTPTLPPGLILPPQATKLETWVSLPANLYFLRDGRIQQWLAEGQTLVEIPVAEEIGNDTILSYRITSDQRYITYLTSEARLYVLDIAGQQHTYLPTAGRLLSGYGPAFEITPDGRYVIYLAWDVSPTEGKGMSGVAAPVSDQTPFGTILALQPQSPRQRQLTLGICTGTETRPCTGFILSPDGSQVTFTTAHGLWRTQVITGTQSELLLPYPEEANFSWRPRAWSPDNHWLLVEVTQNASRSLALFNFQRGEITPIPNTTCITECRLEAVWNASILWISRLVEGESCLYRLVPDEAGVDSIYHLCQAEQWSLRATSPHALPDGWVAFVHQGCGATCPGPAPGIYFLGPDTLLHPIALLPEAEGHALWTDDGSAFIYFDLQNRPRYLGMSNGAGFWDVQAQLAGTSDFYWGQPQIP
ncbi:MAG: hypothetical protein JXA33_08085 [Anaerolineae bacterium]|nr:hypothetical protein [Anaerolineae bacterium]